MQPTKPVVAGAAAITQRVDDPLVAADAVGLMEQALSAAAADAGAPALLAELDEIIVPKGTWPDSDPGRVLARAVGAPSARTVRAELGVLQSSLLHRAIGLVAAGEAEVVAVVGGEARHRLVQAAKAGVELAERPATGDPDVVIEPAELVISRLEIDHGLVEAVHHYALLENALGHADGLTPAEHRARIAELWARYNLVARTAPGAWFPAPMTADEIATPGPGNRPLASPYAKWHVSQWNVDQAAAVLICSNAVAERVELDPARRVVPLAGADSDHVVPVTERAELHRCPGAAIAAGSALEAAGATVADLGAVDLYSCFPVAVRIQLREIGLAPDATPTLTGGMTFGGGPFNNYVLQATAAMVHRVRADRRPGLVTAVSGMLTKQGATVWGVDPAGPWQHTDVTAEVATATGRVPAGAADGPGTIVSATALYEGECPARGVVLVHLDEGRRTLASTDAEQAAVVATTDLVGGRVTVVDGSVEVPPVG